MAAFTKLPSGKFRVQVRTGGIYKAKTFELKRDAEAWAREVERQVAVGSGTGFAPPSKESTLGESQVRSQSSSDFTTFAVAGGGGGGGGPGD